jgi:hypothetical protein
VDDCGSFSALDTRLRTTHTHTHAHARPHRQICATCTEPVNMSIATPNIDDAEFEATVGGGHWSGKTPSKEHGVTSRKVLPGKVKGGKHLFGQNIHTVLHTVQGE